MWTTLLFPNRTMLSPSVWARGTWVTTSSSPLRGKVMSRVKVTTGSATFGSGLVFIPRNSMKPSVESRFLTFSCATMIAPALPRFSLPPVWSKCQWVFSTNLTGLDESFAIAAWILGVSGANWSSITNTASSPTETPRFPPAPAIMYTVSASFSVWISTLEKSCWADAAAAKSAAAQTTGMRIKWVFTGLVLWLGCNSLLDVFGRFGDARRPARQIVGLVFAAVEHVHALHSRLAVARELRASCKPRDEKRAGHHAKPECLSKHSRRPPRRVASRISDHSHELCTIGSFRRRHFKSTGSQRAHRPPVVQRVTAPSHMNQLAYYIVMISLRPCHDFPLVFQTLAAVESMRPPV